jgi:succinate-semialdehyde dehydrogenase / glutarate-semialdehyde dehydrogenase
MSGNVMLVKHAPGVPQCALAFEKVLREAGVPEGVYTNVFLNNDQAGALIDDPRVKGIALTGSERAGEALASLAGKNLKNQRWSSAAVMHSLFWTMPILTTP